MPKYIIELWNVNKNQYEKIWEGPQEYAMTMMNKSYNRRSTRRLIKVTEEIICKAKKGQYVA